MADKVVDSLNHISDNLERINDTIKERKKVQEPSDFERILSFVDKDENVRVWENFPRFLKGLYYLPRALFLILTVVYVGIFYYVLSVLLPKVSTPDILLPVVIATIALILQVIVTINELIKFDTQEARNSSLVAWNFKKLKNNNEVKSNLPLLRALILLKVTEPNCLLTELRQKYPQLITEEKVLAKLYGL
jgi:hypothetical protein